MSVTCSACGYDKNPDGTEFCDACGSEISNSMIAPEPVPMPPTPKPAPPSVEFITEPAVHEPSAYDPPTDAYGAGMSAAGIGGSAANVETARLVAKQAGAPVSEFVIDNGSAIIGIFDPDTGPVEVDLEGFQGDETVSRNHAEIYQEGGGWRVKDLGSTNGVFIKSMGQSRFASRITQPTALNPGDELAIAKVRLLFQFP